MNPGWALSTQFVDSPAAVEDGRNDFFQLVPPTPKAQLGALQEDNSHGYTQPTYAHHLRPSGSTFSLRTHRSMSSVGSMDSHISGLSGATRWSTLTGSDSISSETDFEAFPRPVNKPNLNTIPSHGRVSSLSIDPKLFQAREKSPEEVGSEGDEELATAVPPVLKAAPVTPKKKRAKEDGEKKKKTSHARKQHPEHIPRPRNAFILFRKHVVDSKLIPSSVEMRHQNVSIITAKMWSEAPPEQKAHFNELARIEKEEHMKKYPGYRYQPVYRRTNVIRRRVRKDEAEEEKCRSVAELLLKGKSGEALESEIKEKINKDTSNPSPSKKPKPAATTQKTKTASELSKGAIRALRAQARHRSTASGDWSDASLSRAASLDLDAQGSHGHGRSTYEMPGDVQYQAEQFFPGDGGYNVGEWALQQGFGDVAFSQDDQADQIHYAYPQPPAPHPVPSELPAPNEFYTYDQALPFSPTARSFNHNFTHPPRQTHGSLTLDPSNDLLIGASYPSPTSGLYGGGSVRLPTSARWDRTHVLPSSEIPLEGLGFDDGEMLLQDFGAALAEAGDMNRW